MKTHRKRRRRGGRRRPANMRFVMATVLATAVIAAVFTFWNADDKGDEMLLRQASASLGLVGPLGPKYAGEIVAARAKIFERYGVNIEFHEIDEGVDPVAAVVSGSDTFGVTNSIKFFSARADGQPIVAFAAGLLESSIVFYALERSGIRAPQDFVGKRVGRRAGTDSAVLYDALLKSTGLSRSQIRETSTEVDLDALLDDRVDVIPGHIGREGYLLQQKGVPYTVIRVSDYGIHIPDTVYFATEKTLFNRATIAVRFLQGVIDGWTMTYADMAKSIPFVAAAEKSLTPEQVKFELGAQRDFVIPLGRRVAEFDEQQWKQLRAIVVSARVMDGSVDLGRAVNYDILKEAYRKPISFGN